MAEMFGRYRLDDRLGQGGMGVVYRAWDTVLERVVALKMMLPAGDADPSGRERFFREARSAAQLTHKNIVTIYDLGEEQRQLFLAMEFLDGEDLQRRLARTEKTSLWRKIDIAIEICHAMEFAHAHGVIHRDLKPANIFITAAGVVKIVDFGLARFMASQLTQSNMLMGTLNYMSPEQVRGERADQQSDVFSIGVVLYELFGGRRAFEGDSAASTLYKILQEPPEPLWKIAAELPRELTAIIERSLAKVRDERYPDVATLRHDLESLRTVNHLAPPTPWPSPAMPPTPAAALSTPALPPPVPVTTPASATPAGAGPRRFWPAAGMGTVVLVAIVVWMANRRPDVPPTTPVQPVDATARVTPPPAVAPPPASRSAEPTPAPAVEPPPSAERAISRQRAATTSRVVGTRPSAGASAAASAPISTPAAETPPATAPVPLTMPAAPVETRTVAPAAAQAPASPPPQSAPPPAPSVPQPTPAASQPAPPPATQEAALSTERGSELLRRYEAALEAKNIDQLRRLWPSLGGTAESAMRQEFQHAARIAVDISEPQVSSSGNSGRITFVRHYTLVTVDGQRLQSTTQAVMDVRRAGDGWVIEAIRFSPR